MVSRNLSPIRDHSNAKQRMFNKTVTNFAQVKYNNCGGLNPVSPHARGLSQDVVTSTVSHPSEWRQQNHSEMRMAQPRNELDISERSISVFQPRKIIPDVAANRRIFKKFSAFRDEIDPNSSKVEYKHFLAKLVKDKKHYDSNMSNALSHEKKFLAYKNREFSQRAAALSGNR